MYLVHGIVAACSILLLAPIARADCIITRTAVNDQEIENGVWVLKQMTGVVDGNVRHINTGAPDQDVEIANAAKDCSGKLYFVGHITDFSVEDINKAIGNNDSITEAMVYKCSCKGGNRGKVTFCLDNFIYPAHISTAIGFLIKPAPDSWKGMNYRQGDVDLAKAGDDLLVRMKLAHDCQYVFKPEYEKAKRDYEDADLKYRQDKNDKNKSDMQKADADMQSWKKLYKPCNGVSGPEHVAVVTRPGLFGVKTVTKVSYDGTVTPPQP